MILSDFIRHNAAKNPTNPAFYFNERTITYEELNNQVLLCTEGLARLGIKKGDTFGLLLRNCPEFVVMAMALSNLGAICIPVNFLEKPDRVALILNDAKALGVLTAKEYVKTIDAAAKSVPTLKHVFLRDAETPAYKNMTALTSGAPWTGTPVATENDLMMLLYTSGTTGLPKGVMLTHKNFIANIEQCLGGININPDTEVFICLLPMFHAFSWTVCVLIPLYLGRSSVIIESILPFDPVIKAIWKYKVTLFVAVPQIYGALGTKITGLKAKVLKWLNPVRICISGAAPLPMAVLKAFEKNLGVELLEGYGLTECSPVASLNPQKRRKIGTVGFPLPGVKIELRGDNGEEIPLGEAGEIWIKGDNVMKGYYNKPEETAQILTTDGWFKTGDIGKFDVDGYLSIVDRKKDLIIIKGLNVYPQEVESVIAKILSVKEVAVVGKMDPDTGEETIRAFITEKEGQTVNKAEVFAACRKELAPYKMPKEILIIPEMPKNALQKILKKELRNI